MNTIKTSDLKVNPVFDNLLPTLHGEELTILTEIIGTDGIEEPVKVWGDTIIDGHNRVRIAKELGIESVPVTPMYFESEEEAKVWILRNQLGRRNITDQQRSLFVGQLYEERKKVVGAAKAAKEIAEQEKRSERQVYRDAKVQEAFQTLPQETKDKFISGDITAKELVTAVAPILTPEEQEAQALDNFPKAVKLTAHRVLIAIKSLRTLADDVNKVFENQGIPLKSYAPELSRMVNKLTVEEHEAKQLTELKRTEHGFTV